MAENALVSGQFDLGAALEDSSGAEEWLDVLRIIARYSVMRDETACRLQRVNKAFKFCWGLAQVTVNLDCLRGPVTPDLELARQTKQKRERKHTIWLQASFEVVKVYGDGTRGIHDAYEQEQTRRVRQAPVEAVREVDFYAGDDNLYEARFE